MKLKSLFNLPNFTGCVYLFLCLKSLLFFQNPLFTGYGFDPGSLLATPLPSVIIFLLLALFSFKKKMFPSHLLAAYLWVFYVVPICFVMVSELSGANVLSLLEKVKVVGMTIMLSAPVFIYSVYLYRYEKRKITAVNTMSD